MVKYMIDIYMIDIVLSTSWTLYASDNYPIHLGHGSINKIWKFLIEKVNVIPIELNDLFNLLWLILST